MKGLFGTLLILPLLLSVACASRKPAGVHKPPLSVQKQVAPAPPEEFDDTVFAAPENSALPEKKQSTNANSESQQSGQDSAKDCRSSVGFISDGQSLTFYRNSRVPEGFTCDSEVRVCKEGKLSGSFRYSSCINVP